MGYCMKYQDKYIVESQKRKLALLKLEEGNDVAVSFFTKENPNIKELEKIIGYYNDKYGIDIVITKRGEEWHNTVLNDITKSRDKSKAYIVTIDGYEDDPSLSHAFVVILTPDNKCIIPLFMDTDKDEIEQLQQKLGKDIEVLCTPKDIGSSMSFQSRDSQVCQITALAFAKHFLKDGERLLSEYETKERTENPTFTAKIVSYIPYECLQYSESGKFIDYMLSQPTYSAKDNNDRFEKFQRSRDKYNLVDGERVINTKSQAMRCKWLDRVRSEEDKREFSEITEKLSYVHF